MTYNFNAQLEKDAKESGMSTNSDWFSFQEGVNRVRILSEMAIIARHYFGPKNNKICFGKDRGCPFHQDDKNEARARWMVRVLDRKDGRIKVAQFPWRIMKAVADLQASEDYHFDDVPMPYDLTIQANGAGTKEVEYTVIPSPKLIPVESDILDQLKDMKTPEQIVQVMKEKEMTNVSGVMTKEPIGLPQAQNDEEGTNPDAIPF